MKTLPKNFRKNGCDLEIIKRARHIALLEVSSKGDVRGYEVHKVREMPECICCGAIVEAREKLASNEEFGTYAWSFNEYETAREKFDELMRVKDNGDC